MARLGSDGGGPMGDFLNDIAHGYRHHIVDAGKEQAFWVLVAFLVTFIIVRVVTHSIRAGRGPFRNISVRGRHVHHMVPGIILLLVTGYLANAVDARAGRTTVALFFGIGAALTLDEFALWLHLKDVYWEKAGRRSIDIVIICATIAGLFVLGFGFWSSVARVVSRHF